MSTENPFESIVTTENQARTELDSAFYQDVAADALFVQALKNRGGQAAVTEFARMGRNSTPQWVRNREEYTRIVKGVTFVQSN